MKHSSRIALGYLVIAIVWIGVSDWMLAALLPEAYLHVSLYKGWVFVLGTAALLKFWLGAEESRRDEIEARLQAGVVTDSLTGLRNRAAFIDHLRHAVERARREGSRFGLLYLDVDGFNDVNDTHGHAAGDAVLREVAARLGGDEFVVLAETGGDFDALTRRVAAALAAPYLLSGTALPIRVSIGVARFPDDGADADAMLHAADAAMYADKRVHRGTVAP
jgi:diguanylate cyclase (GGDEF)-like protein